MWRWTGNQLPKAPPTPGFPFEAWLRVGSRECWVCRYVVGEGVESPLPTPPTTVCTVLPTQGPLTACSVLKVSCSGSLAYFHYKVPARRNGFSSRKEAWTLYP